MHFRSEKARPSRGFALLITVTLLAFLVLLLVSLASLTRVETQVANNNQQLAQARQNALMALNIAIGELQKYTGPDQRTTARSDMDGSLANTTTASGRWVGAYGNAGVADYAQIPSAVSTAVKNASDAKGSQAKLLNWLVSGNEGTTFNPDPAAPNPNVGSGGNIVISPASFQFTPDGAVSDLSAATALTETITIKDKNKAVQPARLLVGSNTVGNSLTDYVVAPLKDITADVSGVGSGQTVGRYAWWVGDENIKARVNLRMADAAQKANAFVSSQRAAVELMDASHPSGSMPATLSASDMIDPTGSNSCYDPASPQISQVLSAAQLPMLSTAASSVLNTVSKYRYHDLSGFSMSVISDTYAGGLKKDLSALLSTTSGSPAVTDFIFPPETSSNTYAHVGVPTWGQLRSFAQITASSSGLTVRPPAMSTVSGYSSAPVPTNVGIYPVMTYAAIGFRYIAPNGDSIGNQVNLAMTPIIVLWNPYTTKINGTDASGNPVKFSVGVRKDSVGAMELQGYKPATPGIPDGGPAHTWSSTDVLKRFDFTADGSNRFFTFVIECPPGGIGPGESLVFTLTNPSASYVYNTNTLTNGMNDNYFVVIPNSAYTITNTLGAGAIYRVAVNGAATTIGGRNIPQTTFSSGTARNWGGAGAGGHEVYLGAYNSTGGNYPKTSLPWNTAGLASQNVYQIFTAVGSPSTGSSPYGVGSSSVGYATSGIVSNLGLVQPEDKLATDMTSVSPAFRMVVRAVFSFPSNASANIIRGRERWILQGNIRAVMMGGGAASITGKPGSSSWPFDLSSPDDMHTSSGIDMNQSTIEETALYEFRPGDAPLLGIGQLQHANLGWIAKMPGNAIGNSNGGNNVQTVDSISPPVPERLVNSVAAGVGIDTLYDQAWLLNRALWDHYFVSTVPHAGTGITTDTDTTAIPNPLPNPRHVRYNAPQDADLRDADKAAASLLLEGGFNINSTSEQAWRAVLGGNNRLGYDPTGASTGGSAWTGPVLSRFSRPPTNDTSDPWHGYKQLSEVQVARLASNIVAQIRKRGPSISLADFINRRLGPVGALTADDPRLKGPIQAAIDRTTSGAEAMNRTDSGPLSVFHDATTSPCYAVQQNNTTKEFDPFVSGSNSPNSPTAPYGTSGAGSPQFLTQADVLATIGNKLSARSDTFTVRTYGEVYNPVTQSTAGRAWCEAVVQRLPEYVESKTATSGNSPSDASSTLTTTNQSFGRKYKIVSFRWLSPNDI